MPKINIPTANVNLGLTAPTARGGRFSFDMKSPIGAALQQGGADISEIANLQLKLNERSAGLAATKADANFRLESSKIIDNIFTESSESGDGIFTTSEEAIDQYLATQRANLPSDRAREIFDSKALLTRSRVLAGAYKKEAEKKAAFTKNSFLEIQNTYGQLLTTNPEELELTLGLLDDQIELMGLNPTVAAELRRDGRAHLSKMAAQGLITTDPEIATQMIKNGEFPHLKDTEQAALLKQADATARSNLVQRTKIRNAVAREVSSSENAIIDHGMVATNEELQRLSLSVNDIEDDADRIALANRIQAMRDLIPLQKQWQKMPVSALQKAIKTEFEPDAIEDGTTPYESLRLRAARKQITLKGKTTGSSGSSSEVAAANKRISISAGSTRDLSQESEEQIISDYNFVMANGTPSQKQDANSNLTKLDEQNIARALNPVEIQERIENLSKDGLENKDILRVKALQAELQLKSAAKGENGDPIGLLLRDKNVVRAPLDLSDPQAIAEIIAQGHMAAGDVGLSYPKTFFRPDERAQLKEMVLNLPGQDWVLMSSYLVENFQGRDFDVLIKDFGKVEPWFGHALSLASINKEQLAIELFSAHKQLAKNKLTVKPPSNTDTDEAIKNVIGNAFGQSGMSLSAPAQIQKMANAIYAIRHSGDDFETDKYEAIVHELVGGDPDDRDDTGIIDRNGAQMLLPPNVTATQFDRFVDRLSAEDFELLGSYGDEDGIVFMSSGPLDKNANPISPQALSDEAHFVNQGGSVYQIRMGDGRFAIDENGFNYQVKIDKTIIDGAGALNPRPSNLNSLNLDVKERAMADRFRRKAFTGIERLKNARDAAIDQDKNKEGTTVRVPVLSVGHFVNATTEANAGMQAHSIVTLGNGFKVEAIELNVRRGGAQATHAASQTASKVLFDENERALANAFLIEIARQESNLGKAENTFREKGDRGIWQVNDSSGFIETKTAPSLAADRERIKNVTGINWANVTADDLDIPLISALAAALYIRRFNKSIPKTVQERAEAWKNHYNTAAGEGTVKAYVENNT